MRNLAHSPAEPLPAPARAVEVVPVRTRKEQEVFLHLPWTLGRDANPLWVPPLLDDQRRLLDPKRSPFLKHGKLEAFVAYENGRPVGRICAHIDHEFDRVHPDEADVAFFGFFECPDRVDVARSLLETAEAWARSQGRSRLRGPCTLDSKGEMGALVEGFDTPPRINTAFNPEFLGPLLEKAGYAKAKDLYSYWYSPQSLDPLTLKVAERTRALPNVRIRPMSVKNFRREAEIVQEIYNEAWAGSWGFVPFTADELKIIAEEYKMFVDPEIALVAEVDGEPAAICFAIPDLNEILKGLNGEVLRNPLNLLRVLWRMKFSRPKHGRLILLGIKEKYRVSRKYGAIAALLYVEIALRGQKRGYLGGELGWTLEDNAQINQGIERMGAKRYKVHRVYERPL